MENQLIPVACAGFEIFFIIASSYLEFSNAVRIFLQVDESVEYRIYDFHNRCEIKESFFNQYVRQYSSAPTFIVEVVKIDESPARYLNFFILIYDFL